MRAANTCRALADLRVIDLTGALGAICGKILADLGADVLRIEPPGGHPLRRHAPLADGVPDGEAGLGWWAYAAGCDSGILDLTRDGDRARLLDLAARADVVLESFAPGHLASLGLGWDALSGANPGLVLTSITPFGQTGPRAGFRAPELVLQAMGGMIHHVGDPDRPPVRVGGDQATLQAGGQAAVGTLRAFVESRRTGHGQWLDVSAQTAAIWTLLSESALPALHGFAPVRDGAYIRSAQSKRRVIFACRDGFVALSMGGGVLGAANMTAFTALMAEHGMAPAFMRERDWKVWDTAYLLSLGPHAQAEIDAVADAVGAFVAIRTKAELYAAALDRSLLLAPVSDMADLVRDAQLAARGALVDVFEPRLGRAVRRPGPAVQLAREPIAAPRPAPVLTDATRAEAVLRPDWATRPGGPRTARPAAPFEHLRVIDFAWVVTGPLTGRLLAEGGADVIRVESGKRLDPGRTLPPWPDAKGGVNRSQMFANANAGKRSVALDLARPEARELARRLVARADVVVESFTPGTMARWGLGYDDVRALRPDVVYLSTCQQGQTGPYAQYRGYGSLAAALAGFYAVTGWPDREPPMVYGAYTDFVAHHFATAAVLGALIERDRTGLGQHIDVSQLETGLHFLAPEILDYTVNGRIPARRGNADAQMAPHGVYPCAAAPGEPVGRTRRRVREPGGGRGPLVRDRLRDRRGLARARARHGRTGMGHRRALRDRGRPSRPRRGARRASRRVDVDARAARADGGAPGRRRARRRGPVVRRPAARPRPDRALSAAAGRPPRDGPHPVRGVGVPHDGPAAVDPPRPVPRRAHARGAARPARADPRRDPQSPGRRHPRVSASSPRHGHGPVAAGRPPSDDSPTVAESLEDLLDLRRVTGEREVRRHSVTSRLAHSLAQRRITQQPDEGIRHGGHVADRDQVAGLAVHHHFLRSSGPRGHDGPAGGHGLDDRTPERLLHRRCGEHVDPGQQGWDVGPPADHVHVCADSERVGQRAKRRDVLPLALPDQKVVNLIRDGRRSCGRAEEHVESLPRDEASDRGDELRRRRQGEARAKT